MGLFDKIKQTSDIIKGADELISKGTKGLSSIISKKEEDKVSETTSVPGNEQMSSDATGLVVAENGLSVPAKIETLDQMQAFLDDAQSKASTSIQSMLQVQMTVVRYIQSPTLVDSSLDTMIMALRESLDTAEDEKMAKDLRKMFHRLLANYIFFMDARLKVEIEDNREAGNALLAEAGAALAKSVVGVASMAVSGPIGASAIARMSVKNVFGGGQKSLLSKTLKWYGAKREIQRKTSDFYDSLINIVRKLDKYHNLIGKSMLISGAIERYANAISEYIMGADIKASQQEINRLKATLSGKMGKDAIIGNIKDFALSVVSISDVPYGPLDRYKQALAELDLAKETQREHSAKLINLSKNKDIERIEQCQAAVDIARNEVEELIAKAQAELDDATRRKEEYFKEIMEVAAKYDEV